MLRNKSRSKRYCEGQSNNLWKLKMKEKGRDMTEQVWKGKKSKVLGNQQII